MPVTTRFAPSPTGYLHLGHAYAAATAHAAATNAAANGHFLLRLEDIDPARCRPAYAAAILEDLAWLGLHWHGPVRVQSAHMPAYAAALATLRGRALAYPCFCSRADIAAATTAPHDHATPIYPGTCRTLPPAQRAERLAASHPHAWRLDTARALAQTGPLTFTDAAGTRHPCHPAAFGDVVLARRDAPTSYHLAVTHDDAAQGVTLVTRAEDLLPATAIHRLLQAIMGWPEPRYAQHALLRGPDGRRLSKRDGAPTIRALRAAGHTPAAVLHMAHAPAPAQP